MHIVKYHILYKLTGTEGIIGIKGFLGCKNTEQNGIEVNLLTIDGPILPLMSKVSVTIFHTLNSPKNQTYYCDKFRNQKNQQEVQKVTYYKLKIYTALKFRAVVMKLLYSQLIMQ